MSFADVVSRSSSYVSHRPPQWATFDIGYIAGPKPAILHVFSYTSTDGALEELARISEGIRLSPESTSSRSTTDVQPTCRKHLVHSTLLMHIRV